MMNTPSTNHLSLIPSPPELQQICKSISALEAIICHEWQYRYYSYQKDWSEAEEVCEMRNGEGDQMLILFNEYGVCINGFAKESVLPNIAPKIASELPEVFNEFIFGEPIKSIGTTFCIWQTKRDKEWQMGKIDLPDDGYKDGSSNLLQLLTGKAINYKEWAEEYYEEEFEERALQLEIVEKIFAGTPITHEFVKAINPDLADLKQLVKDLTEIGYEYNF